MMVSNTFIAGWRGREMVHEYSKFCPLATHIRTYCLFPRLISSPSSVREKEVLFFLWNVSKFLQGEEDFLLTWNASEEGDISKLSYL